MSRHKHCRECGGKLDSFVQPGFAAAGVPDRVYVTCWNMDGCALGGMTLDDATYDSLDIGPYLTGWRNKQAAGISRARQGAAL